MERQAGRRLRVLPPDSLVAIKPAALDVSEPGFAFATELELTPPAGDPVRLPVTERQTVLIPPLPAGNYQLHKPRVAGAAGGGGPPRARRPAYSRKRPGMSHRRPASCR